jgi:hypothetical protein
MDRVELKVNHLGASKCEGISGNKNCLFKGYSIEIMPGLNKVPGPVLFSSAWIDAALPITTAITARKRPGPVNIAEFT